MTRTLTTPHGILPARLIADYCAKGLINPGRPLDDDQIQPASLDLRLGEWAYRVRASFLPGPKSTVEQRLKSLVLHRVNLSEGAVLETGCVYIVPLLESLKLPKGATDELVAQLRGLGEATGNAGMRDFNLEQYRFAIFGLALVLLMLLRPEGLAPSRRRKAELHPETDKITVQENELYTISDESLEKKP